MKKVTMYTGNPCSFCEAAKALLKTKNVEIEEIKEKSGKNESEVIKIMRKNLKPSSFKLWRKRVHNKSIKHRKKFQLSRKKMVEKIKIDHMY